MYCEKKVYTDGKQFGIIPPIKTKGITTSYLKINAIKDHDLWHENQGPGLGHAQKKDWCSTSPPIST